MLRASDNLAAIGRAAYQVTYFFSAQYYKYLPRAYESVPINICKSAIEPMIALLADRDMVIFGDNLVATTLFRDLALQVGMGYAYIHGKTNTATHQQYCALDFVANGLRALSKIALLAPVYFSSDIDNDKFAILAQTVNFITEPPVLFVNKIIVLGGAQEINVFKFVYQNYQHSWSAEILVGSIARSITSQIIGMYLAKLNLNKYIYKPAYDFVDNEITQHIFNITANFTTKDNFLTKVNKLHDVRTESSLESIACTSMLFCSNIAYGFVKEAQGWLFIASPTRMSYSVIKSYLDDNPIYKTPAIILSTAIFITAIANLVYEYQHYEDDKEALINLVDHIEVIGIDSNTNIETHPS
jgi:hypothetical protein